MTKVIVSYACELEDVPRNTSQLLSNVAEELTEVQESLEDSITLSKTNAVSDALKTIDTLRQQLAKIDLRLMDCSSILAGYTKTNADIHLGHDANQVAQVAQGTQEVAPRDILSVVGDDNVNSENTTEAHD
jgi:hypothetical protein|tara:strand:+ start:14296 stop:14688 length:393 start_codon:yes stop_codon:yes gene_type:complete